MKTIKTRLRASALSASALLFGLLGSAYTLDNGRYTWQFVPGAYRGNYDAQGIPNALKPEQRKAFDADFWTRLSAALPESTDIRQTNPANITSDQGANLHLVEEGDVWVNFLHEGAGYRNSFGYFTFDAAKPPTTRAELLEKIVFPNASFAGSGGSDRGLHSGDEIFLGRFPAGTSIGFVVVSNGFDASNGVKPTPDPNWIFTTLRDLNAEKDPALRPHTVLFYDAPTQQAVLGLEDMLRTDKGCDHDFNDIMFSLRANPPEAIDNSQIKPLPEAIDSDGDGVLDANDGFPEDAARAFHQYYPEQGARSTLAFEDNWPAQGDYDMNDLVLRYAFDQISNAKGEIRDIQVDFELAARGADLHNAFALEIPGVSPGNVARAELIHNGRTQVLQPESGQPNVVLQLIDDASRYLPQGGGACRFYNTQSTCAGRPVQNFSLKLSFKNAVSKNAIGLPPYNPFIYRTDQRGYEIHLPNHPPTARAASALFGSKDDVSKPGQGQFYKTRLNLPWALDVPNDWAYPTEQSVIASAYLDFKPWAESGGQQKSDWYRQNAQLPMIWR
ncbi:MAG: LruC domain-containing protein [Candidatus Sericytochromatia bacterium]